MKKAAKPPVEEEDDDDDDDDEEVGDEEAEAEDVNDLRAGNVGAKYRVASEVANKVLAHLVREATPGKKVIELVLLGDELISQHLASSYKGPKVDKGVAFPVCVSLNNCVGHNSPLPGDTQTIQEGDLVKIDLGVHVSGYIALVAHSFLAGAHKAPDPAKPADSAAPAAASVPAAAAAAAASASASSATSTAAAAAHARAHDVLAAAHFAAEAALRLLKPGKTNADVTAVVGKIAETYHCTPVQGVLCHQMKCGLIDGERVIILRPSPDQKVEEVQFKQGDVWGIDIVMSAGDGKPREQDTRTTIYKLNADQTYLLKLKSARTLFSEIQTRFSAFPFGLRAFKEVGQTKLGITELLKHELLFPYPVMYERAGEFVAQIKFTALILPASTDRITSHPAPHFQSQYKITDPAVLAVLATGTKRMKKNKKAKKKKGKPASPVTASASAASAPASASATASATAPSPADKTAAKAAAMDTSQ